MMAWFDQAVGLHGQGRLDEAERIVADLERSTPRRVTSATANPNPPRPDVSGCEPLLMPS